MTRLHRSIAAKIVSQIPARHDGAELSPFFRSLEVSYWSGDSDCFNLEVGTHCNRVRSYARGTHLVLQKEMTMIDDDSLSKITSLQYAWKREGLQFTGSQNRLATAGDEFFSNLKQVLSFDLRLYAQGRTNLNTDLGEVIYRLYRGAVLTRFFSADAKDAELAQKLMDGVANDLSIRKSDAESKTTPVELIDPSWFNLMVSWQHLSPTDESPDHPESDESDKEISFQEICIFIQKTAGVDPAYERRLIGLLALIANQHSKTIASSIANQLREVFDTDRQLFTLLINQRLLKRIWSRYSVKGVADFLASMTFISERSTAPILGSFLERLCDCIQSTVKLTAITHQLKKLADHEGVAKETLDLLMESSKPDKAMAFIEKSSSFEAGPLSIDAQRIMLTILTKYKLSSATINDLGNRLFAIGLSESILKRLTEKLISDSEFAGRFAKRRFETDSLISRWENSVGYSSKIYRLVLLAIQEFEGSALGSITRGLSVLSILKEKSKIDDSHYRTLMNDMTYDLPGSLARLHEQPDAMDLRLKQLYVPLSISGELLHRSDHIKYFSDSFYELRQRDRNPN